MSDMQAQLVQSINAHVVTCHHCATAGPSDDYCAEFFTMTTRLNNLVRHSTNVEQAQRLETLESLANALQKGQQS